MEELRCKGTPAQVARRVLAVLTEDPDLFWLVSVKNFYPPRLDDALIQRGRRLPPIPDDQDLVQVSIYDTDRRTVGCIVCEQLSDFVLVTSHNRSYREAGDGHGAILRSIVEDFAALAPVWEKVKAELDQRGLVIDQAQLKQRGPTDKTQIRAEIFRRIKEQHPDWGYNTVAVAAMRLYPELGDSVTVETVRNAYKAMGWTWDRGDRAR